MYLLALILVPLANYAHSLPDPVGNNQKCPTISPAPVDMTKLDGKWYIYAATPMQLTLNANDTAELKGECASAAFQHHPNDGSTAVNITWIDDKENVFVKGSAELSTDAKMLIVQYSGRKVDYNVIDIDYAEYAVLYWCIDVTPQINPDKITYNLLTLVRKPQPTDTIISKIQKAYKTVNLKDDDMKKFLNKEEVCKPTPPVTVAPVVNHTNPTEKVTTVVTTTTTLPSTINPPPTPNKANLTESTTKATSDATNMVPTYLALVSVVMSLLRKL